jgi:hypothetical protein
MRRRFLLLIGFIAPAVFVHDIAVKVEKVPT